MVIEAVSAPYPYDVDAATTYLRRSDSVLSYLIDQVGDYKLEYRSNLTPFQALVESITFQQLSGHAASAIHNRVLQLYPHTDNPSSKDLLETPDETLRSCGLSKSKVKAIKDLAFKADKGDLPELAQIEQMEDQQVIDAFTTVWGIGQWTVEMLLIFNIGRPDVLPIGDLGVRRGFMHTYGLEEMPDPKSLLAHGERWKPYRSIATWYLWRAADGGGIGGGNRS